MYCLPLIIVGAFAMIAFAITGIVVALKGEESLICAAVLPAFLSLPLFVICIMLLSETNKLKEYVSALTQYNNNFSIFTGCGDDFTTVDTVKYAAQIDLTTGLQENMSQKVSFMIVALCFTCIGAIAVGIVAACKKGG